MQISKVLLQWSFPRFSWLHHNSLDVIRKLFNSILFLQSSTPEAHQFQFERCHYEVGEACCEQVDVWGYGYPATHKECRHYQKEVSLTDASCQIPIFLQESCRCNKPNLATTQLAFPPSPKNLCLYEKSKWSCQEVGVKCDLAGQKAGRLAFRKRWRRI